jgi:urease accessory protein
MAIGGLIGHLESQWPWVDHLVAASVFVIGALLAGLLPGHRLIALLTASCFLLIHGYAHGMELPSATNGLSYGAGFLLMSAVLIWIGRGLGHITQQRSGIQTLVGVGLMGAGSFWLLSLR